MMSRRVVKWILPVLLSFVLCTIGTFADDSLAEETFFPAEEGTGKSQEQTGPAEYGTDAEMFHQQDPDAELSAHGADPAEQALEEESQDAGNDGIEQSRDKVFPEEENPETSASAECLDEDYSGSGNREDVPGGDDVRSSSDVSMETTDDSTEGAWMEEGSVNRDNGTNDLTDEEDLRYGECGKEEGTVLWEITSDGILTIYGNGEMQDYIVPEEAPWSIYAADVVFICVTEGVASIGNNAFSSLKSFSGIQIAESVKYIGTNAFCDCAGLKEAVIGL